MPGTETPAGSKPMEPYVGQEQDTLLRTRLLTEDRQFRRLTRKLTLLTAPELREADEEQGDAAPSSSSSSSPAQAPLKLDALPPKLATALASVQTELASLSHTCKRNAFLASTALPAQRRAYAVQSAELDTAIAQRTANIAKLQAELALVRRERKNKLIYDEIARRINALPTRAQLADSIARLQREIAALKAEAEAYDELDASARARFRTEVCDRLEVLQHDLGEEVGKRERSAVERAQERGEDVDAEVAALEAEAEAERAGTSTAEADAEGGHTDAHPAADAAAGSATQRHHRQGPSTSASEEREPGEVDEHDAAGSSSRTGASAAAAAKRVASAAGGSSRANTGALNATAAEFTPSGKTRPGAVAAAAARSPEGRRDATTPSRASTPLTSAAVSAPASGSGAGPRRRTRTHTAEEEGELDDGAEGTSAPTATEGAPTSSKGKARAFQLAPAIAFSSALDDDTASSLTSLEEGEASDLENLAVAVPAPISMPASAPATAGRRGRAAGGKVTAAAAVEEEGEDAEDDAAAADAAAAQEEEDAPEEDDDEEEAEAEVPITKRRRSGGGGGRAKRKASGAGSRGGARRASAAAEKEPAASTPAASTTASGRKSRTSGAAMSPTTPTGPAGGSSRKRKR
ncbi:hypothetical protein OC844_006152 [Tilletia horrida]|nr:hypothetical protein OC844_006152 [Tilletia horrida]